MDEKAKEVDAAAAPRSYQDLTEFNSTTKLADRNVDEDDDDYNPFEHRNVAKPNSTTGSLVHLLKSSLGTGILAMPVAFKNAGLLFGAIGTIVVGILCTHCVHILVRTSHDVCKKSKTASLGFSETAGKVFEYGPVRLRSYAKFAKDFVDYSLLATYFGANCVYVVFIAASVKDVCNYRFDVALSVRLYVAMILLPVILIGQIRELKYLVPFSAMANAFIVVVFSIVLYYMFNEKLHFEDRDYFASFSTLPLFFSTVIFAMEGIGVVMPVENQMKKPQHFLGCPGVLNTAMITVVALYAVIGFFGYVKYGDEVKGSVTLNLPVMDAAATVAQLLIAVAILFTFGLQFYVPMDILWRKIGHKIPKEKQNIAQYGIRTGIIICMGGIAVAVPDLEPFIGLVGAVFFSTLGLFVPSVVETVFLWPDKLGPLKWVLIKNVILAAFAIFALISGSYVSIKDIIELYKDDDEEELIDSVLLL